MLQARTFRDLVAYFLNNFANPIISILVGIALVVFLYGVFTYIRTGASEENIAKGRDVMLWGIVALTVMVSFWGIVALLQQAFFGSSTIIPGGSQLQQQSQTQGQQQLLQGGFDQPRVF